MDDWIEVTERKPTIMEAAGPTFFAVKIKDKPSWYRSTYSSAGFWVQIDADGARRNLQDVTHWRKVEL